MAADHLRARLPCRVYVLRSAPFERTLIPMIASRSPFPEFVDTWRIREVGDFSLDEIDQLGKAIIRFDLNGFGVLRFRRVTAEIDCRYMERGRSHFVDFTWFGANDQSVAAGRGWACVLQTGGLMGHLFVHRGQDWPLMAARIKNLSRRRRLN